MPILYPNGDRGDRVFVAGIKLSLLRMSKARL